MINTIELRKLRNGEYSQLIQDILKITFKNNPTTMEVKPQYNALLAVAGELEVLFKVATGSGITPELENLDLLRDNALKGITSIITANTYSDDPVARNHAIVLEKHLALFGGNIPRDSYQSETSSIRNIIADWNAQPELADALTALNLNGWKTALENANNSFGNKYIDRAEEVGGDNSDSLKAKRIQVNEAYYKLRDNINARYTINEGADPYHDVVSTINGLIGFYNDLLARRGAGKDETPPPPAPPIV